MKCIRRSTKKKYNCFHLYKDNVKEFLDWLKHVDLEHKYSYIQERGDYLFVATGVYDEMYYFSRSDLDNYYEHEFDYNYWYVFDDDTLYDSFCWYNSKTFHEMYDLIED